MASWQRPESVPYPSVWRTFERNVNGVVKKYWVQDYTPEYEDIFFEKMLTVFLKDEPLCKYSKFCDDPVAVEKFTQLWRHGVQEKLALICLTKDEDGAVKFVGGNLTCLSRKGEKFNVDGASQTYKMVIDVIIYISKLKNSFEELQVNEYLTAYGLYVLPEFRGQGIATEILRARRELCLAVGLKASGTIFTSIISQKNAKQAGFKEFIEQNYDELDKINPEWRFPGITEFTKSSKYMIIKYE